MLVVRCYLHRKQPSRSVINLTVAADYFREQLVDQPIKFNFSQFTFYTYNVVILFLSIYPVCMCDVASEMIMNHGLHFAIFINNTN